MSRPSESPAVSLLPHAVALNRSSRRTDLVKQNSNSGDATTNLDRTWLRAILFAAVAIVAVMTIAVVTNLAIGRIIHWEIVTVLGTLGFVFLAIGRKFKTI